METKVFDRQKNKYYTESSPKGASFLYDNFFGRLVLKLANKRFTSRLVGHYMNTKMSVKRIAPFIKEHNIDMDDYPKEEYKSFNDFFSRKIIPSKRRISYFKNDFIAPCDSKVLVYKVNEDSKFIIKEKEYTVESIFRNSKLAKDYKDGYFVVFRLSTDDYHRYHFIDNGRVLKEETIKGVFYTVGPIAFNRFKPYEENQREYSILKTENFGQIVQMEIGATCVGKIVNNHTKTFKRGDEKGYFQFGGSTVVIMIKKDVIEIDNDILENTKKGIETKVRLGEIIGKKKGIK